MKKKYREIGQSIKADHKEHDEFYKDSRAAFAEVKRLNDAGYTNAALREAIKALELAQKRDAVADRIYRKNNLRYGRYSKKAKNK